MTISKWLSLKPESEMIEVQYPKENDFTGG